MHMVASENLIHGRDREGPWTGACMVEDSYIRERGNIKAHSGQLPFAVEFSLYSSSDLYLGVQEIFECVLVVGVHVDFDVASIHEH